MHDSQESSQESYNVHLATKEITANKFYHHRWRQGTSLFVKHSRNWMIALDKAMEIKFEKSHSSSHSSRWNVSPSTSKQRDSLNWNFTITRQNSIKFSLLNFEIKQSFFLWTSGETICDQPALWCTIIVGSEL